jgi:hypothetical protein
MALLRLILFCLFDVSLQRYDVCLILMFITAFVINNNPKTIVVFTTVNNTS